MVHEKGFYMWLPDCFHIGAIKINSTTVDFA